MSDQHPHTQAPKDPGIEHILDETIDLEEFARRGEAPPLAKGYRLRINGEAYVVQTPKITGRELLTLAHLLPPENYTLRIKHAGDKPKKVALDEVIDLRHKGIEKFKALPRDQTEG
jgi:hypothetical protein